MSEMAAHGITQQPRSHSVRVSEHAKMALRGSLGGSGGQVGD